MIYKQMIVLASCLILPSAVATDRLKASLSDTLRDLPRNADRSVTLTAVQFEALEFAFEKDEAVRRRYAEFKESERSRLDEMARMNGTILTLIHGLCAAREASRDTEARLTSAEAKREALEQQTLALQQQALTLEQQALALTVVAAARLRPLN